VRFTGIHGQWTEVGPFVVAALQVSYIFRTLSSSIINANRPLDWRHDIRSQHRSQLATDFNGYCGPTRWLLYYELLRLEVLLGRTQTTFDGQPSRAPVRCRAGVTCISISLCSPARQCCLVSGHSSVVSQLLCNSISFSAVTRVTDNERVLIIVNEKVMEINANVKDSTVTK